jgi:glycine oxidase
MNNRRVIIVGAGIIGLATGRELSRLGHDVTIFERGEAGREASFLAAGMLAADAEIGFEEIELYRLSRESLDRWPEYARRLTLDTGIDVDYRSDGTLTVANDPDSAAALRRMYDFQREQGVDVSWLSGAEALEIEPFLTPRLTGAVLAAADHQVDNRLVIEALKEAFLKDGGTLNEGRAVSAVGPDSVAPSVTLEDGSRMSGDVVVLAAGSWSRQIGGKEPEMKPPVRPVKGQILELATEAPFDLRFVVRGPKAYLAPKSDGRLVVGATSEEMGFDQRVTAGGVYRLLEGAWEIVPGIYDLPLTDTGAGLRPGTRDNDPILGWSEAPGVYYTTGHFRHGIVQTVITAQEAAREIGSEYRSDWFAHFRPGRFIT